MKRSPRDFYENLLEFKAVRCDTLRANDARMQECGEISLRGLGLAGAGTMLRVESAQSD